MRNNDLAYAEFHRRMREHDILMLPLALKRNHISGAHTSRDIDNTLVAAKTVLEGMQNEGMFG